LGSLVEVLLIVGYRNQEFMVVEIVVDVALRVLMDG